MKENLTFEQANLQLEETIQRMENETLSLKESVELYSQASELLVFCMKQLEESKGKIEDINERLSELGKSEDIFDEN